MAEFMLPEIERGKNIILPHFPTQMQAFIFRMWDMIPCARIAKVLKTTTDKIEKVAYDMGLAPQKISNIWLTRGYITIIRSAWHVLPYNQLLELLDWSEEKLAYVMREDDFLGIKLGNKPDCDEVIYRELTAEEKAQTKLLIQNMQRFVDPYQSRSAKEPFDLFACQRTAAVLKREKPEYAVEITEEWGICDLTGAENVPSFVKLFQKDLKDYFGFNCQVTESIRNIILRLDGTLSDEEEYYEVSAEDNEIVVTAAQAVGILRGLMHLLREGRTFGGAYVRRGTQRCVPAVKTRYIYSFCGLYTNAFDNEPTVSYPDELLRAYARLGVNGVFTQAVLYKMTPFPFDPSMSDGWRERLENLKRTVAHLKKYGIKLYLYLNEPRSMALVFFEKFPELKGFEQNGYADLCTTVPEVREYLSNAVVTLCSAAPDLGGFFVITRSENPTNCYSHIGLSSDVQTCPRCAKRKSTEVIAEVHNVINRAAKRVNHGIITFANTWQWMTLFSQEETAECMHLLDSDIPILCISEESLDFVCGGVKNAVEDYSISKVGPSELSLKNWKLAKEAGHEIAAKVQFNNTWECSTVPFIPAFDLIRKHMKNLAKIGIEHLMLSWTLGGYPSDNLEMISDYFFKTDEERINDPYEELLEMKYENHAQQVKESAECFSEAFAEFPFDVGVAYVGPHNAGVSNLLYMQPTGFQATMTCYCYDDLQAWRGIYPLEIFEKQWQLLRDKWQEGMKKLEEIGECELLDMAQACDCIFTSCCNQIQFIRLRDESEQPYSNDTKKAMCTLLESEIRAAQRLYSVMQRNPSIGYEAANHYYYNQSMIKEKIISCRYILEQLS